MAPGRALSPRKLAMWETPLNARARTVGGHAARPGARLLPLLVCISLLALASRACRAPLFAHGFPPLPSPCWQTEHKAPEAPPVLELVPRAKQQRACDILQTWSMPTTPSPSGKRPRATWSLDEPILKYALRHADSSSPAPVVERQQAPSPPAKRVRATRPDGSPLLPEGWREEVRIPASGREYRVRSSCRVHRLLQRSSFFPALPSATSPTPCHFVVKR